MCAVCSSPNNTEQELINTLIFSRGRRRIMSDLTSESHHNYLCHQSWSILTHAASSPQVLHGWSGRFRWQGQKWTESGSQIAIHVFERLMSKQTCLTNLTVIRNPMCPSPQGQKEKHGVGTGSPILLLPIAATCQLHLLSLQSCRY